MNSEQYSDVLGLRYLLLERKSEASDDNQREMYKDRE
jgi:hypothetical protein